MFRESIGIDCGRGDDDLEVGSPWEELLQITQ
ncbi:MAG: hypothetical protein JW384_02467 [Nitrosomonadaceae bacterium]|nr:hypothetical protein [Nitrosomonadaceae bacterium]